MVKYIIIFVIICLLVIVEWMREIHTFKITNYYIKSKKLNGLQRERKIVFLSDLHNYCYGEKNEKLLNAIRNEKPDLIVVSGDMIVGKPGVSTEIGEYFMKELPTICEVFFANGNHEQRMKEQPEIYGDVFDDFINSIKASGVKCLSNEWYDLIWDDIPVRIYGLELRHGKFRKFIKQTFSENKAEALLGKASKSHYNILIAHNPVFMDSYLHWGADLALSGHFHGGVVRLPFVGGVVTPQFTLFPKYSGEMTSVGDAAAVVSKGIGLHTIKVRLFNPAEVVVMHINGTED